MNVEVGRFTREGFISALSLRFDSGLVLCTKSLTWAGAEERKKPKRDLMKW